MNNLRGIILGNKGAFYNGIESDNSDNDDENYNENIGAVIRRCRWFFKINVLENFINFSGKHLCLIFFFIEVVGPKARLQHKCKETFSQNNSGGFFWK